MLDVSLTHHNGYNCRLMLQQVEHLGTYALKSCGHRRGEGVNRGIVPFCKNGGKSVVVADRWISVGTHCHSRVCDRGKVDKT